MGKKNKMLTLGVMGLCVVSVLLMRPIQGGASHEGFAVYEDWSAQTIRSDRWSGIEVGAGGQEITREVSRRDRLHMRYRIEGVIVPTPPPPPPLRNLGRRLSGNNLNFRNPATIDQIEADFEVARIVVTECAINSNVSEVNAARLNFATFNDGSSTGSGDSTGDHFAAIVARRLSNSTDANGILRVLGRVSRCGNSTCSAPNQLVSEVHFPQTVKVGDKFTLRLVWDEPTDRFLVGVDANPDMPLPYTASDALVAVSPFASVGMFHAAESCTIEMGTTVADAETEVIEVRTNSSAVIP